MSQPPLFRRRRLGSNSENRNNDSATSSKSTAINLQFSQQPRFSLSPLQTASLVNDPSSAKFQKHDTTLDYVPNPDDTDMPCRDRTQEFRTIGKSLQMKLQANGFPTKPTKANQLIENSVVFNRYAKKIGTDLSSTFAKLEKLSLLAKKRSLFDDRISEIDDLTHIIKLDIASLNKQIAQLQDFLQQRQGVRSSKNQTQNHSNSIVVGLQSKLASMSNEFKQVLEVRTENLKQQRSRREKFGNSQPIPSTLPPSASVGHLGSVLLLDEESKNQSNGSVVVDMDRLGGGKANVQQQMALIDEQDSYIRSRAEAMENIESTVVELGQIFSQLAHMVQEQGEMVQRIDSNVEETSMNVEAAHMELLKYLRNISNNRWLALKVFGVLIVFFIIFIVFLV